MKLARLTLAALLCFDAVVVASLLWGLQPTDLSHPDAPPWLLGIGASPAALISLVALTVVGAALFAIRERQPAWALLSLLGLGLMVEAQGALLEGPMRFLFFTGVVTLGWLLGVLALGPRGALAGARSALAACYLGAVSSKLLESGLGWVVDGGLQATIAAQHRWGSWTDGLTTFVLEHALVAHALAAFTLVAQASAVLLPFSARGRRVAAGLLLCFHAGVWVLTPISFPQAMVLLVVFGWLRLPDDEGELAAPRWPVLVGALVALMTVGWLPPVRAYTAQHHARRARPVPPPVSKPVEVVTVPGLAVGDDVAGFRVELISRGSDGVPFVRLVRPPEVFVVDLVKQGARGVEPPMRVRDLDLFFRTARPGEPLPDEATRSQLLAGLADKLSNDTPR